MTQGKRLVTEEQIIDAIDWCLLCVPDDDVQVLGDVLWQYSDDFSEDRPEVAEILSDIHYPRNRKSSWSLACAILADQALRRNNKEILYAAGIEVLKSFQQSKRGTHHNRKTIVADALDECIAEYLADFPGTSSNEIFQSYADACCNYSSNEILVEFDQDKDELVCQLDPTSETLTNISRQEFRSRVSKLSKTLTCCENLLRNQILL